jgi:DegV family protein with EDD domain
MPRVIISADRPCDLGLDLIEKYDIRIVDWRIFLEDKDYIDSVEIFPEDIYKAWEERKVLPKSTATVPAEYAAFFKPLIKDGDEIVHLGLGSGLSGSFQHACSAAQELGNVYPVDSQNLSTGVGQLVIKAAEMAQQGMSGSEIQLALQNMCRYVNASFLLDTLEFMQAGGRCSTLAYLGANLFNIKPCIEVNSRDCGCIHLGEKYRGKMERCLRQYVHDRLSGRDDIETDRLFITHSGSPDSDIELVREEALSLHPFKEVHVSRTSSVITTHCGPRTLGIAFMTRE